MSVYFVSTLGNNSNVGNQVLPWRTLQHAMNNVVAGDTVYIRGGTYAEVVTFQASGLFGAQITIQPYQNEIVVFDGATQSQPDETLGLFTLQSSFITISSLQIINSPSKAIAIIDGDHHTIEGIYANNNNATGGVIMVDMQHQRPAMSKIRNCFVSNSPQGGITVWSAPGGYWLVEGNAVRNVDGVGNWDGIQVGGLSGGWHHVIVTSNSVEQNQGGEASPMDIGGHSPTSNYIMENNLIFGSYTEKNVKMSGNFAEYNHIQRFNIFDKAYPSYYVCNPTDIKVYNNTFILSRHWHQIVRDHSGALEPNLPMGGLTFKNNVWIGTSEESTQTFQSFPDTEDPIQYDTIVQDGNGYLFYPNDDHVWAGNLYSTNDPEVFSKWRWENNTDINSYQFTVNPIDTYYMSANYPARDGGIALTQVTGGSGTSLLVEEAGYFSNGYGLKGGDTIRIGKNIGRISAVDYETNEITLETSVNFSIGDPVNMPYSGKGPNLGAL